MCQDGAPMVGLPPGLEKVTAPAIGSSPALPPPGDLRLDGPLYPCVSDSAQYSQILAAYHQIFKQYNTEVPYLQAQVLALSTRVAELESWKQSVISQMHQLRGQHKEFQLQINSTCSIQTTPACGEEKDLKENMAPGVDTLSRESTAIGLSDEEAEHDAFVVPPVPAVPASVRAPASELMVSQSVKDGVPTMRAEWQIFNFRAKILAALRNPLVSPAFHMHDQDDLRLMIHPQVKVRNGMRMREEKELFTKKLAGGKLAASLSLKVPNPKSVPLRYMLEIGQTQRGLLEFNFGSTAIDSQGSFDINWLDEVNSDGSLTVAMEMLQPEGEVAA